jgi:hypothetical protein
MDLQALKNAIKDRLDQSHPDVVKYTQALEAKVKTASWTVYAAAGGGFVLGVILAHVF